MIVFSYQTNMYILVKIGHNARCAHYTPRRVDSTYAVVLQYKYILTTSLLLWPLSDYNNDDNFSLGDGYLKFCWPRGYKKFTTPLDACANTCIIMVGLVLSRECRAIACGEVAM